MTKKEEKNISMDIQCIFLFFETSEFVKPFYDFSNVHTEKIDFQAYYGPSAETNTFRLVGAKPISEEDHNKITGAKR